MSGYTEVLSAVHNMGLPNLRVILLTSDSGAFVSGKVGSLNLAQTGSDMIETVFEVRYSTTRETF
jgi:hypothetical protein